MGRIKTLTAREILDSRGIPTLEGTLTLDTGVSVTTQIPSSIAAGIYEGKELRDGDILRYKGFGVLTAAAYINKGIAPKITGVDISQREDIDAWMLKADGTERREKLGVNTILTVSILLIKAQAAEANLPLYVFINQLYNELFESKIKVQKIASPIFNLMNGGMHGVNNLNFQEFHVIPSTSTPFPAALQLASELHSSVLQLFTQKNIVVPTADNGGYIPTIATNLEALDLIMELSLGKKYKLGLDVFPGIDCDADAFYKAKKYVIKDTPGPIDSRKYVDFLVETAEHYSVLLLEDPVSSDDLEGWKLLQKSLGDRVYLVADNLISGNRKRLQRAIDAEACNALLIKLSQTATITELLSLVATARKGNMKIVVSQRTGETNDDFIVDLAIGIQADFVKFGAPIRGERVAKYNRLLQIYEDLFGQS